MDCYDEKVLTRIAEKFEIDGNECWVWTAAVNTNGYGCVFYKNRMRNAHRLLYELSVEGLPANVDLDHLCRNKLCINPDHLEPVSHRENVKRGDLWKVNGLKTHCSQGHPYDTENTYYRKSGGRQCKECSRHSTRRWKAARCQSGLSGQ